jgi:Xaa-Pro aminopeptidase
MIFTVEPVIYHSDQGGIRLEDDVSSAPVTLSTHPLQLRIL